ncbi:MAG TPA: N-acetylmuramoyl-L-alanine amidase, partial [bacterium]|nr:N-acetylmuramoyl-L-alanine amidase [bacterium]
STPGAAAAPPVAAPPVVPPDASGMAPEPLALPPLPEFTDRPGAFHVQVVAYDDQGQAGRIVIQASQHVTYAVHEFVYPERLAIDITGGVYLARRHDIEVDSETVQNIVVSQFQLKPNLTRVLVHLNRKMPYSAAVADAGRMLVVTLGDPGRRLARGSAVIVDPGHGGNDGGAVGPSGLREADVALAISRLVHDALTGQGIASVLTRTEDTTVPLEERPDLAQRNGGVVFVSIHANASRSVGAAGTETYYATPESQALARVVQSEVSQALGEPDRGIRTADFYVLVNTPMPSVLVETAFITNPTEETMLRDPAVQRRIADAIARGITKYLRGSSGTAP